MSENNEQIKEEGQEPEKKKFDLKKEVIEYAKMLIGVFVIVFVLNGLIFINSNIPSASMENTVMTGDRIFGFRLAYGINIDLGNVRIKKMMKDVERYDVVIFHYPDDESELFIKRVIGLPGETLEVKDGIVYIDGTETDASFTHDGYTKGTYGPITIPEGCYFCMGDNRQNSLDSRFWQNTFVTYDQIVAKAFVRYWPLNKIGLVK